MLFKDLKVGDTLYIKNRITWNKPIKKTIGKIEPFDADSARLDFYDENGAFLGTAMSNRSSSIGNVIFADFEGFKKFWIEFQKKNVEYIEAEMKKICEALEYARQDLTSANNIEDVD
ncbi:MAG: hypothetical protein MJZ34_07550 [Paludibacteraceae bacterium]|nr:hypothetical protein [Paludibacteraceae bacterium]